MNRKSGDTNGYDIWDHDFVNFSIGSVQIIGMMEKEMEYRVEMFNKCVATLLCLMKCSTS